jgi:hypothetical protein
VLHYGQINSISLPIYNQEKLRKNCIKPGTVNWRITRMAAHVYMFFEISTENLENSNLYSISGVALSTEA